MSEKFQSKNYIQIQGWMITDLKLSGNELLTYALIYGFSQDGQSKFTGSISYLCSALNCSRPTAGKALTDLVEKGLLLKEEIYNNGVKFCHYSALPVVKKLNGGSKETLLGGSKETLPNNKLLDNKEYNKKEKIIKKKIDKNELEQDSEYKSTINWMSNNAPTLVEMEQPLNLKEFLILKSKFSKSYMKELFEKMDNYKPLKKKNRSVYKTFMNWARRDGVYQPKK